MTTKNTIEEMKREHVINELRKHAHPQWFHSLLSWSTEHLKSLLAYYTTKKATDAHTQKEGVELGCSFCSFLEKVGSPKVGIDLGHKDGDITVFTLAYRIA